MIVDDSLVARTVLGRMLSERAAFEVVAQAATADQALAELGRHRVDIILLDVEMPGTDGLTALPLLIERSHGARVLIVSSACEDGAAATLRALALGAADTLPKPGAGHFAGRFAEILADRLLRIGHAPQPHAPAAPAMSHQRSRIGTARMDCIAIGASTGGIHALSAFFAAFPASCDVPILVTQHLPAVFMPYFAAQMQEIARRPARVATDGAPLVANELLIAPGDAHISLRRLGGTVRVRLDRTPAASGCLPSVDPMFAAVAEIFGAGGVGLVLSGMGRDGALGAEALVAAGGELIAQDAASSVVWGMPGVVAGAGLASEVLPPAGIGHYLASRIAGRAGTMPWR
ncbi:chemotaxis response regulator protein-glutamate methylesterase [Sphingomonas oleivorans]|uniref:protein-glutamate methylesterase n=2 Tax=Sphingomonas oleivorans TaxID=1735121 RepID=A0A2T5FTV3_9SPHN|nr:chemotaxis-specific protein-glutamate methyltransferase CheB [Sphingomonas oleivorans]PTQ07499.1 chemotaxis response regulator protein-glutamate methylesterase [Sphingomonas oleivorans]